MKTITSPRCILKQITKDDAAAILEIYSDTHAMKYMQSNAISSLDEAKDLITKWKKQYDNEDGFRWGVFLRDNPHRLIGTIALHYWDKKSNVIELGADLVRSEWRKGLAYEFTEPVVNFAFTELKINRLELRCDPRNIASVKIAEKFAFTFEGTLREYVFVKSKGYLDESVYSLLRKEFNTNDVVDLCE